MLLRRFTPLLIALSFCLFSMPVWSEEPVALDGYDITDLVIDQTANCRKEKDQSTCINFFSSEGIIVQVQDDDGERKDGRWFVDDSDRLCILWNGKLKPLCFVVIVNDDETYNMIKHEKHISTILKLTDGNINNL